MKDIWKIQAHNVEVKTVSPSCLDGNAGLSIFPKNIIKISSELKYTQYVETLVHEIIHFCNGELEERVVDGLAQQLTQVLLDNAPKWSKLLSKRSIK